MDAWLLTDLMYTPISQGLFVNFRRLLDYNNSKMPFAAAQIGLGFRNEIAPRAGLLRVREFWCGWDACMCRQMLLEAHGWTWWVHHPPVRFSRVPSPIVRRNSMAEIEHFVNPKDKAHPKFKHVAAKELVLFPNDDQLGSGKTRLMSIGACLAGIMWWSIGRGESVGPTPRTHAYAGEAVAQGIVNNETLGYFMTKTWVSACACISLYG